MIGNYIPTTDEMFLASFKHAFTTARVIQSKSKAASHFRNSVTMPTVFEMHGEQQKSINLNLKLPSHLLLLPNFATSGAPPVKTKLETRAYSGAESRVRVLVRKRESATPSGWARFFKSPVPHIDRWSQLLQFRGLLVHRTSRRWTFSSGGSLRITFTRQNCQLTFKN